MSVRFRDWSLRTKAVVLILLVSVIPVGAAAMLGYAQAREEIRARAFELLKARADHLASELDAFHAQHRMTVQRMAVSGSIVDFVAGPAPGREALRPALNRAFQSRASSEPGFFAAVVIDAGGTIMHSTYPGAQGYSVRHRRYFNAAMRGETIIGDLFLTPSFAGERPLIVYAAPVLGKGLRPKGVVVLSVRADAFWKLARDANGRAGVGSYAIVLDRYGIRIAHSFREDHVFRPTGPLPKEESDFMVSQQRFGVRTAQMVEDVIPQENEFRLARMTSFPRAHEPQRYFAATNGAWNLAMARRLSLVPWTLLVVVPESSVYGFLGPLLGRSLGLAGAVIAFALLAGLFLVRRFLRPLLELASVADAVAKGDLARRVRINTGDEIGRLARRFNEMTQAIEAARAELEGRVKQRTLELEQANSELVAQREELLIQKQELEAQQHELEIKNREVERADRTKSEFLANMSHELRTPLNSVIGFAELLQVEAGPSFSERHGRFVADVLASGRHLLELINDILDLSKIEAGRMDLALAPVPAAEAIEEACGLVRSQADSRRIALTTSHGARARVLADAGRVRQILLNLLSNAIKFSPEGSTVEMGTLAEGAFIRFHVRDEGLGIDEALSARLFQPFVQGESALVKRHQGTGLGLAISRRIVEAHGGHIGYEHNSGAGTTFWFTLPVVGAHQEPVAPVGREPPPTSAPLAASGRVLIVDDDPVALFLLTDLLETAGFQVDAAPTAAEALRLVREAPPAAAIVDLMLPDMSGFELVERLTTGEGTRALPIIVMTAATLSEADRARLRPSVQAIAIKGSVLRKELLAALERAMAADPGAAAAPARDRGVILVVDDHDLNRGLVRTILERLGYEVHEADDGAKGVEMARRLRPALVLMDIAMPVKDGLAATRELKSDPQTQNIPIVALTALAMRGDEKRARDAGAEGYLTKPIDRGALEQMVGKFIAGKGT